MCCSVRIIVHLDWFQLSPLFCRSKNFRSIVSSTGSSGSYTFKKVRKTDLVREVPAQAR